MAESGGEVFGNALGVSDAARPLGDWAQDAHLIDGLQRQPVIVGERAPSADENHRDRIHERVGDSGDRVGDAGPRGDDRDAGPSGGAGPSVGHVRCGLLVTSINHAHAVCGACGIDRIEVPAVEGEDFADAFVLESPHDHLAAVDFCHW